MGPGTPTAERPGLNPGACGFESHPGYWGPGSRLGRQWADHPRLERGMLRVRLPPEPSVTPSWSSPECSPLCQSGGRGFKSRRRRSSGRDGTVRKPAKRPGSNPGILWVRLPPVPLADRLIGWCSSRRSVKPSPPSCEAEGGRFDSFTTHYRSSKQVRSSIGRGRQPLTLERRVRFPHGPLLDSPGGGMVDARASEARAPEAWEFESPPGDCSVGDGSLPGEAGARLALMRPICPARYRGLGLRVGRCSAEFHTLGGGGSTPRPATLCSSMARHANRTVPGAWCLWVRTPPVRLAAIRPVVQRPGRLSHTQHGAGSSPAGTTRI